MTTTPVPFIVLKHKKTSFVYAGPHWGRSQTVRGHWGGTIHINGKPYTAYPAATGDDEYLVVPGDVVEMMSFPRPTSTIVHYIAKDEYLDLASKSPISTEEFDALDGVRQNFYRPIMRVDDKPAVPVDFEVIDIDCEPRKFPAGVMVRSPEYLLRFKNTWHVLPCFLERKALFDRLTAAVKDHVAKTEAKAAGVTASIYEHSHAISAAAGFVLAGIKPEQKYSIQLFHYSVDGRSGSTLPQIEGNNLSDLEAKVAKWIDEQIEKMSDVHTPKICPCCGGKVPKDRKLVLAGRR